MHMVLFILIGDDIVLQHRNSSSHHNSDATVVYLITDFFLIWTCETDRLWQALTALPALIGGTRWSEVIENPEEGAQEMLTEMPSAMELEDTILRQLLCYKILQTRMHANDMTR